jgi:hypothetical protein
MREEASSWKKGGKEGAAVVSLYPGTSLQVRGSFMWAAVYVLQVRGDFNNLAPAWRTFLANPALATDFQNALIFSWAQS